MNKFIFALSISIMINFILLLTIEVPKQQLIKNTNTSNNHNKYIHVNLAKIQKPKQSTQLKKAIPKKVKVKKPKKQKVKVKVKKTPNKTIKKQVKVIKKQIPKKPKAKYIKVEKKNIKIDKPKKQEVIKEPIKELIMEIPYINQQSIENLDPKTKQYIQLYGDEYFGFSPQVKQFLETNIKTIGEITQQYLIYPSFALRSRQQGTNVLEFILKTSGDIKNLHIISSSDSSSLDRNSIKTIKFAHKDYPRPKSDTKIKIFINYILN